MFYSIYIKFFYKLIIILILTSYVNSKVLFQAGSTKNCTCVPFFQCSEETNSIITDGSGLLELRKFKSDLCTGDYDVCCTLSKINVEADNPLSFKGCGYKKSGAFSSWHSALFHQKSVFNPPTYKCGVSLIHKQVALTAAHCINEGLLSVNYDNKPISIKTVSVHPQFNFNSLQNDIALLFLEDPINSTRVEISCIPPPGYVFLDSTNCKVSSSNVDLFGSFNASNIKVFNATIMGRSDCETIMKKTRLGVYFRLDKGFICAGDVKNSCGGDGGSPLICPIPNQPNRYHQAGIVSWGMDCGESVTPSVYINASYMRDWIDEQMIEHGFDINSYRY